MIRLRNSVIYFACILIISACSSKEEEVGRKELYDPVLHSILYLYPDFKTEPFINYDNKIVLSDEITWGNVVEGYEYQLKLVDKYSQLAEDTKHDYYKGRIMGEEIDKTGESLIFIDSLISQATVILPEDASPELKDLAEFANKKLKEMALSIFETYEIVWDDKKEAIIAINQRYGNEVDGNLAREKYEKTLNSIRRVVSERE